jgi:hypothetical protein
MRDDLAKVRTALTADSDPFYRTADLIAQSCGIGLAGKVSARDIQETMN